MDLLSSVFCLLVLVDLLTSISSICFTGALTFSSFFGDFWTVCFFWGTFAAYYTLFEVVSLAGVDSSFTGVRVLSSIFKGVLLLERVATEAMLFVSYEDLWSDFFDGFAALFGGWVFAFPAAIAAFAF